jgi:hypothetical protein
MSVTAEIMTPIFIDVEEHRNLAASHDSPIANLLKPHSSYVG